MPLVVAVSSCRRQQQVSVSSSSPVLKIAVFSDGRLTVDGPPVTVESLRTSLKRLADKHGTVWYYREAGQQEPPPIAMQVMQAVVGARLPVRLSSRPDYSDAIGLDGRPVTP